MHNLLYIFHLKVTSNNVQNILQKAQYKIIIVITIFDHLYCINILKQR